MTYDLVIRDGDVVDGSGLARFRADVGIRDGRIAKIGRIRERGAKEIDAAGHVVTPGFIDGHTHMDAQINWDPLSTSSCYQGVTTVVMGNCGFTLAPSLDGQRELVMRNLERAEDIPAEAMTLGIKWRWETFPEYLDVLEKLPMGINHAVYVGHSALRTWAMGERAFDAQATDDELSKMTAQLTTALAAGAMGLSTSRSSHKTSDGRPVASRVASWDEIRHLVGAMGDAGKGIFEFSKDADARSQDPERRARSINRIEALAVDTGTPLTFGINGSRYAWREHLDLLDRAAKAGGRVIGQTHSRGISSLLSFRTYLPFDSLPTWAAFRQSTIEEQERRLRDPAVRAQLIHAANHETYAASSGAEARKPIWEQLHVYTGPLPPHPTLAELSTAENRDPVEIMIDLAMKKPGLDQFFIQDFAKWTDEYLLEMMRHPRTVMTFSDSGAHVGQICDSSIHTHLLAYWVRQRQDFTFEEAIRMITLAPATAWGFHDRGLLREGLAADINVIDPETVAPQVPEVVHDLPGGSRRLLQKAEGIRFTVVNGQVLFEDGRHTGQLPGKLLRQ